MNFLTKTKRKQLLSTNKYIDIDGIIELLSQNHGDLLNLQRYTSVGGFVYLKITLEKVLAKAESLGGKCLSTEYRNCTTKLQFECKDGHRFEGRGDRVLKGVWCRKCACDARARKMTKTIQDMQNHAAKHGGLCLSTEYHGSFGKLTWQCSEGHQFESNPSTVQNGHWCSRCNGGRTYTSEEMKVIAAAKGLTILSTEYINCFKKLSIVCKVGHRFLMCGANLVLGSSCRKCYSNTRKVPLTKAHELAAEHGGECLSTEYQGNKCKLNWRCAKGHEFSMRYNDVQQKHWCKQCTHMTSYGEQRLAKFVSTLVAIETNVRGLLPSSGLELDIWIPTLFKAIEYDGKRWHAYSSNVARDARKNAECAALGIDLLRIGHEDYLADREGIERKVEQFVRSTSRDPSL